MHTKYVKLLIDLLMIDIFKLSAVKDYLLSIVIDCYTYHIQVHLRSQGSQYNHRKPGRLVCRVARNCIKTHRIQYSYLVIQSQT